MDFLTDGGLPYELDGLKINPDFRNMIRVEELAEDPTLALEQKLPQMLQQLYPRIPKDPAKALERLVWFFQCGDVKTDASPRLKVHRKSYHFRQDASLIYVAFLATYGINLATIELLHWWEFLAMFQGLPEGTLIRQVMYWRTCDVSKLGKEEKRYILEMRKQFAIRRPEREQKSIAQVEQDTHDYYERRIALAQEKLRGAK